MSPRQYTLGKRAVGAQSTRDQILRSAGTLVARGGMAGITVEDVAQHAGVARLTVYKHFNSKAGLLEALAWSVFARADIGRIREARLHPDVDTALRSFIVENTRFLDAVGKHGRAVLSWAISDPQTRAAVDDTYIEGRRSAITELVTRLHEGRRLPRSWSQDRTVAALMVLTSLEATDTLITHQGSNSSEAGTLLAEIAAALFHK